MDPSVYEVCATVTDLVRTGLESAGRPVNRAHVGAGAVAWDDCCGLLVVAPERIYRSRAFPVEYTGMEECSAGFITINLVVLLVRCVPMLDAGGQAPPVPEMDAAYRDFLEDAALVWNIVSGPLGDTWDRAGVAQVFSGDDGGCVGVETRVTIGIDTEVWP